ncbi:SGNH/GDSL hydrolase family protein [Roseomonas sp. F4]
MTSSWSCGEILMKLCVFGGSNTAMKSGYLYAAVELARQETAIELDNYAVGAASTLHGLQLSLDVSLKDYDAFIIEYVINDYKLSNDRAINMWRGAYEGLIRKILVHNPRARILSVLLGRRDAKFHVRQARIKEEAILVSKYYNVDALDVDGVFRDEVGNDPAEFSKFYSDGSHYRRPDISNRIAEMVSDWLLQKPAAAPDWPKEKMFPWSFENCENLHLGASADPSCVEFSNSMLKVQTRKIDPGEEIFIETSSAVLALSFIAVKHGGALLIQEADQEKVVVFTTHKANVNGKFNFLLRSLPFSWKDARSLEGKTASGMRLRALTAEELEAHAEFVRPQYNMEPSPVDSHEQAVFVQTVMLSGRAA